MEQATRLAALKKLAYFGHFCNFYSDGLDEMLDAVLYVFRFQSRRRLRAARPPEAMDYWVWGPLDGCSHSGGTSLLGPRHS